jgi:hypothetical protein
MKTKRASYYRKNPLDDTELIVGGLVVAAVIGIGGFFIYQHFQTQAAAAALPSAASLNQGLIAANAASGQAPMPGGTGAPEASQVATG